jgi:hypothetical protein
MRYSALISILFLSSCSSFYKTLAPTQGNPECLFKFEPQFSTNWFDATVDVVGNHISGLILFKKMPDGSMRVAFTSKTGLKFFDFEFKPNGDFHVYYVIEQLDKKAVIKTLRKDFEVIMMKSLNNKPVLAFTDHTYNWYAIPNSQKGMDYYVTKPDCSELVRIENAGRKKALEVRFSNFDSQIPGKIHLRHFTFKMEINLTKLEI